MSQSLNFFGFVFAFLIVLIGPSSFAAKESPRPLIIYIGTFDPFHLNHLEQLQAALEAVPNSEAVVGIVQRAPHSVLTSKTQTQLPTLFDYDQSARIVKDSIAQMKDVRLIDDFRFLPRDNRFSNVQLMTRDAMNSITRKMSENGNRPVYHLIGTDVLDMWVKSELFPYWSDDVKFIIGYNPELHDLYYRYQEQFKGNPRFIFVKKQTVQIRSSLVRAQLLEGSLEWITQLQKKAAENIRSRFSGTDLKVSYLDRMELFLQNLATEDLNFLPLKSNSSLEDRIQRLIRLKEIDAHREKLSDSQIELLNLASRSIKVIPNVIQFLKSDVPSCRLAFQTAL